MMPAASNVYWNTLWIVIFRLQLESIFLICLLL